MAAETSALKEIMNNDHNSTNKDALAAKKKKRMSVERIYQKKTQLEHILLRPDTYIGSVEPIKQNMWVYDADMGAIVSKEITFVPGLYKIFDEILVNAADNKQRDPSMGCVKITIDAENNSISVWNDGRGIPVEMHKEQKVFVPTLIFGHLLTSSNYNDAEKKVTGGRNGYGAKLCNIFSTKFVVETCSSESGKRFKQTWSNNMGKAAEPIIKDFSGKDYTCITFKPDLAKFKMESLDSDTVALLTRRAYDVAGSTRGIGVYLNGKKLPIKSFKDYVGLYLKGRDDEEELALDSENKKPTNSVVHEVVNNRWEVCVTTSMKGFQQASFVNSIATTKGGTHVNYVADQIAEKLMAAVKKKNKGGVEVKPFQIKNHLWIFINCLIENPSFDSQTKENMTLRAKAFGSKCEFSDKFIKQVTQCGVVEHIMNWVKFKAQTQLNKKCQKGKHSKIRGIPKLDDANDAGGRNSQQCTLILTEGDSAKTLAVSGLSVVGRDQYGVFPLRGKLLNVRDASHKQILENAEINNLIKIVGLQYNKKYSTEDDLKSLRYGHIMIMTDQDQDGSHIKGLLINFIHSNWPNLTRLPFLEEFITPIVKVSKGKEEKSFYSIPEYEEWKNSTDNAKSWKVKYYKGLGTSTPKEAKEYFADMRRHQIQFHHEGAACDEAILMAFSKKKVNDRKDWLNHAMEDRKWRKQQGLSEVYLYEKDTKSVSYSDFVNKELVLFSNADNERSIPCLVDGFKPGQRKVLFTCLKRNDKREVKVAQLAGSVAELSAYHHGEQSLMGTIINLAQNFVGSNNVNLLQPVGQFGTRIHGGKDAASPRYIFTMLSPLAKLLFPAHDMPSLTYLFDDNQPVEPEWYCPILPTVMVNGAEGIGTGYSTKVPNFDVRQVVSNLKKMINGEEPEEMIPSYKDFTGTISQIDTHKFLVQGNVDVIDSKTVEISELPVGTWTQSYKENVLEPMLHGTEKVPPILTDYKEYHTDVTVKFVLSMTEDKLAEAEQSGLHKKFKLESTISTSNMVLFDALGCLRKYESPKDILKEFFELRLERYAIRKAWLEGMLTAESSKLSSQARFILEKIDGQIILENRSKRDIITSLVQHGFPSDPVKAWKDLQKSNAPEEDVDDASSVASSASSAGGPDFNYLLSMSMLSLSREKKEELLKERDNKMEELETLRGKSPQDLWLEDLELFLEELENVEQQEREDQEMCLKPKGGRSQQQKKKPSKQAAKKPDNKPKAQEKKPAVNAEEKQKKKAEGQGKATAASKKAEKSNDSWEFDDGDTAPPVKSLADRLAQRQKLPSSSSSSAGSGTESVGSSASRSKKQTMLEMFGTKKKAAKKAAAESDDDFIMQFSDEEDAAPPPAKRTARSAAPKAFSVSSDDDDDDLMVTSAKSQKKSNNASLDSDAESDKSDVQATRALIQKLSPAKPANTLQSRAKETSEDSVASKTTKKQPSKAKQTAGAAKKPAAKKAQASSKGSTGDESADSDLQKKQTAKKGKGRKIISSAFDSSEDSDAEIASSKKPAAAKGKAIKPKKSPPKKSKPTVESSSDDEPLEKAVQSRPQRAGRAKATVKYFEDDSDSDDKENDNTWLGSDSDFDTE
ncbi:DNA topoisomerase 2-alpha-like isoform X1 [Oculina patagonica]